MKDDLKTSHPTEYILTNVRLEDGFRYDKNHEVIGTETVVVDVHISAGKVREIAAPGRLHKPGLAALDAESLLLLPAMRDMHIHIDKTFYGTGWRATPLKDFTVNDIIEFEQTLVPELLPDSRYRAEKCVELLQSQGSVFARCHCNIEPVSGLRSLEHLRAALHAKQAGFGSEIVAFPQHGILHSHSEGLLREAAQMGVDFIGGLDPTTVDGQLEKSLDTMFDIALDTGKGVDIHLHEKLPSGKAAMEYMLKKVRENKTLQGKTFISHGFALAGMAPAEVETLAAQFAEYGIGFISTVPLGKGAMPLPLLKKHGVKLMTGTDSIVDHWMPFGSGDMLEKANLCAQLYGWTDEYRLNRSLHIATDDVLPLDADGQRVWPHVGAEASFVLVRASCSAEAVARLPRREAVFYQGRQLV